ncbi:MAG: glycosyltransferase [Gemmatimonadaceae bacterium]|nr:glycosyltransferase [Gemmatimonadaceae bacterium]
MPTAVLQLDATHLPPSLQLAPRYEQLFLLVSWRGRPMGHGTLVLRDGFIDGELLRDGVERIAGRAIGQQQLTEWLGWDEHPLTPSLSATIAVCTRDRIDDLDRCLRALSALPNDGQEVLVIDSASRNGEGVKGVVDRFVGVRYVREQRPGLDIARNRALREATGAIVAFCDDDAELDGGWLRALCRNFANPRTLCVTGLILPRELETDAQEWFERTNGFARGYQRVVHDGVEHDPFFVSRVGAGASMALRRSVIDLLGPFDEALDAGTPTQSGGDHDYFTRILAAGYRIVYDPAALCWHRHRREWHELRAAVRGYGTGVWAYLTRQLLQGEWRAPYVAAAWLRWQLVGTTRGLLGLRTPLPLDLALAELRGCFAGPRAYLVSQRRQRAAASPP